MIGRGPSRSIAAVAAFLLAAVPAAAQMDVAADICAAIDLAPREAAAGLVSPLLAASLGAESDAEAAENRSRFLHFLVSDQARQAAAIEAQIAEMRYGSRSPAALDAEVAAAEARRAQRADALAALIAGRRRLEALERQAQSDPSAIEPAALERARAAVGQLEQDLPGAPLNVMDQQVANAQAAAAARRAEIAALEERRRQALDVKARHEAEIAAIEASLPRLQAAAGQYRAALAQVWSCAARRMAETAPLPAPVVTTPVVAAPPPVVVVPPPMAVAPAPLIVAPPHRVSIPIATPIPSRPPRVVLPPRDSDFRRPPPRASGPAPRHPPVAQRSPYGPPPRGRASPRQTTSGQTMSGHVKPAPPRPPAMPQRKQMPSPVAEPADTR